MCKYATPTRLIASDEDGIHSGTVRSDPVGKGGVLQDRAESFWSVKRMFKQLNMVYLP